MTKNACFGPNLAVFGPKILIFMWVSKSFGIHITEKTPRQLVRIVFRSGIGLNGPKMPIFGQKCQFLAKLAVFGSKFCFLGEGEKLLVLSYQGINETPILCWKHWPVRLQLAANDKNVQFWPKIWIFGAKSQFFVCWLQFLWTGQITSIPGATTFPFGPLPKEFPFPS